MFDDAMPAAIGSTLSIVNGPTTTPLRTLRIGDVLTDAAERYGPQPALISVWQQRTLTFTELEVASRAAAAALLAHGITTGDRVGVWSANRVEWIVVQYATSLIGAILVNINPAYRGTELGYVVAHAGCKALFVTPAYRGFDCVAAARDVRARTPTLEHLFLLDDTDHADTTTWSAFVARASAIDGDTLDTIAAAVDARSAASIQYTSGTTGAPKGATLSHFNVVNNAEQIGARVGLRPDDRICLPVPLFHCFGMVVGVMSAFLHGSSIVFPGETFDAGACLAAAADERCTMIYGVPMMFIAMLNHADFDSSKLTSLRGGLMGGAPCPAEIVRAAIEGMHMRDIAPLYGMTETSPISFQVLPDDSFEQRVQTVGVALPHIEAKIIEPGSDTIVPIGRQGELCVRGYLVMLGYWDNPEATARAIDADGWMHTGDLAVLREDRHIAIVGRIKDMVIRGGENIFPREIEEYLHTLPEVAEAQVFGIPDALYGEQLCAWIRVRPGAALDADGLRSRCHGRIASFKIPTLIRFVDEFPTTASGKVQKFRMREIEDQRREKSQEVPR